jgi:hypothetical protein
MPDPTANDPLVTWRHSAVVVLLIRPGGLLQDPLRALDRGPDRGESGALALRVGEDPKRVTLLPPLLRASRAVMTSSLTRSVAHWAATIFARADAMCRRSLTARQGQ